MDKFEIDRKKLVSIISVVGFTGSACFATYAGFNYILDIVDSHVGNYIIATLGLVETLLMCRYYGIEKIRVEANEYSDFKIGKWFNFLLQYVTPLILGITVVTNIITGFAQMNTAKLVFGWGTILIMIVTATIFYRKQWEKSIE